MRPACFLSKKQVKRDFRWLVRICCLGELIRGLQNLESPFEKVLILFVRSRHCGELNRGLQNLDSPFGKVLILFVGSRHCGELNRGLQNLEAFRKGTILFFLHRAKRTKKHARMCKKLPVASFCASENAETGRIANGRVQGDHVSRRRLRPATRDSNLRSIHGFC